MSKKHKSYTADEKAKIALEAIIAVSSTVYS